MEKTKIKTETKAKNFFEIMKYAGAFVAWVIGSGFATGQEILQFFGSYSYKSIAVLVVNFFGFLVIGLILVSKGFDNKENKDFNHYRFYCGKTVGKIYSVIIPVTILLIISVLISAAGATLNQYYSVNRYLGSIILATLILAAYLVGFERMVKIVSSVSPLVIIFAVFVGTFTVLRDYRSFSDIGNYTEQLSAFNAAPHWLLSSVLYISLNFLSGSAYYTELGKTAKSKKNIKAGAILGALALMVTITLMTFAILLNAKHILSVPVPTLFLAEKISGVFGTVFSVTLILGMFAASSTMVWSFCSGFFKNDKKKNKLFSVFTVAFCLVVGFTPFGNLLSVVYPMIGYAGLFFIFAVLFKGTVNKKTDKKAKNKAE